MSNCYNCCYVYFLTLFVLYDVVVLLMHVGAAVTVVLPEIEKRNIFFFCRKSWENCQFHTKKIGLLFFLN